LKRIELDNGYFAIYDHEKKDFLELSGARVFKDFKGLKYTPMTTKSTSRICRIKKCLFRFHVWKR